MDAALGDLVNRLPYMDAETQKAAVRVIVDAGQGPEALRRLKIIWWGDDPTNARRAWEAIEKALDTRTM